MLWLTNTTTIYTNYGYWLAPFASGTYEVFVFIPRDNATTQSARYQITHNGIHDFVTVNQNDYYAVWVSMGTYTFGTNGSNYVLLADQTNDQESTQVGYDAVAFVPFNRVYLPVVMKNYKPLFYSTSRYMQTTDWALLNQLGCNEGAATPDNENIVIILDFGQPWFDGNNYGVRIFGNREFRSTSQLSDAVKGFLSGYYRCSPPGVHLALAVGTNNSGPQEQITNEHGRAWAQMVNDLNTWIASPPSYADKLSAKGAIDIEPDFNDSVVTRAWADGYTSAFEGSSFYYNFGSCDGCPFTGCPDCIPNNGWTQEDVWYVSWGATAAFPLPEIYLTNGVNADQWYHMSIYAVTNHYSRMYFVGSLTQWQACHVDPATAEDCKIRGIDNTPAAGWQQLYDALHADPRTQQPVDWATDIRTYL
jgi:hypothetical protein